MEKSEFVFQAFHKPSKTMYWFDMMWGNCRKGDGYIGMVEVGKERETDNRYNGNQILIDPNHCIIRRPTGLKDKNGKEIYESDILGWHNQTDEPDIENHPVTWEDGCFCVDSNMIGDLDLDAFIVLGNIFENPDLLPSLPNNQII